ncbi:MAG: biotin transporter BioY [Synergistaceae bacterium]|nr:biotin transporter BioY [Synergistaceae bacterium]
MKTRDMAQISIFAVLMIVGAKIIIPFPLVPITLQPLVSMLAGLLLGSKRGAASQALYIFMGLIGIPVFTTGGGMGYVLSPTFGYLVGFVACSWIAGKITDFYSRGGRAPSKREYLLAAAAGILAAYAIGLVYLYAIANFWLKSGMTLFKVLSVGFFSAIPGDVIKALVAAMVAERFDRTGIFTNR